MFLRLLHVETKFFTNVKPSSKMQTVVSYVVFTYRFKKNLNQASHFTLQQIYVPLTVNR